jgi:hypothetical protein
MPFSEVYRKQAALLGRALSEVAREDCRPSKFENTVRRLGRRSVPAGTDNSLSNLNAICARRILL